MVLYAIRHNFGIFHSLFTKINKYFSVILCLFCCSFFYFIHPTKHPPQISPDQERILAISRSLTFIMPPLKVVFVSLLTLQNWELLVLNTLKWDISVVTPLDFLEHILTRLNIKNSMNIRVDKVREHAQTFISMAAQGKYQSFFFNFTSLSPSCLLFLPPFLSCPWP